MRRWILDYFAAWLALIELVLRPFFKVQWYKSYLILLMLRRMTREGL